MHKYDFETTKVEAMNLREIEVYFGKKGRNLIRQLFRLTGVTALDPDRGAVILRVEGTLGDAASDTDSTIMINNDSTNAYSLQNTIFLL